MKVAIVCDWLTNVGGAEKVLLRVHQLYPDAPIYTSQYDPKGIDWFRDADVRTGKVCECAKRQTYLLLSCTNSVLLGNVRCVCEKPWFWIFQSVG